jgi:8-oxo-dGTP pyrophosphatase MutT (NUDIX family)
MTTDKPSIATIRQALRGPLPGRAAQIAMAVKPRPGDQPDLPRPCPREGAVLLLLTRKDNALVLPLTCRTTTVEHHAGQISFPGGAREPADASFRDTALRETYEELGVPPLMVEVLGELSPLYIPSSRFCVYPFVGYVPAPITWQPDPAEVSEVLEAPLGLLMRPETVRTETHIRDGKPYQVPMYAVGPHRIWGATAMMLSEFVTLLRQDGRTVPAQD